MTDEEIVEALRPVRGYCVWWRHGGVQCHAPFYDSGPDWLCPRHQASADAGRWDDD